MNSHKETDLCARESRSNSNAITKRKRAQGYNLLFGRASKTVKRDGSEECSHSSGDDDPDTDNPDTSQSSQSSDNSALSAGHTQYYRSFGGAIGQRLNAQLGLISSADVCRHGNWFSPLSKVSALKKVNLPHPSTLCSKRRRKEKPPVKHQHRVDIYQHIAQLKRKQADWNICSTNINQTSLSQRNKDIESITPPTQYTVRQAWSPKSAFHRNFSMPLSLDQRPSVIHYSESSDERTAQPSGQTLQRHGGEQDTSVQGSLTNSELKEYATLSPDFSTWLARSKSTSLNNNAGQMRSVDKELSGQVTLQSDEFCLQKWSPACKALLGEQPRMCPLEPPTASAVFLDDPWPLTAVSLKRASPEVSTPREASEAPPVFYDQASFWHMEDKEKAASPSADGKAEHIFSHDGKSTEE